MYSITVYLGAKSVNYNSNVLPMVGDVYSCNCFDNTFNPDLVSLIVYSRQLLTYEASKDSIVVNVRPVVITDIK